MKQKGTNHSPEAAWRQRTGCGYAAMGVVTAAMAVGLFAYTAARTTVSGTLLPVAAGDASVYGISEAYRLEDGSLRVTGTAKGFQSDVTAAVTLTADGGLAGLEILSQGETEGFGANCVSADFTGQFAGVTAPVVLSGKGYTVTDPVTGAAYAAAGDTAEEPSAHFDSAGWNLADDSAEAAAMRAMYAAGLTKSAQDGTALKVLPVDDKTPEGVARRAMYAAGLSASAIAGEEQAHPYADLSAEEKAKRDLYTAGLSASAIAGQAQAAPYADLSAEEKAAAQLADAGLTAPSESTGAVSAELSEVDALSGATVTSTAVAKIVNNAYFYVTQVQAAE